MLELEFGLHPWLCFRWALAVGTLRRINKTGALPSDVLELFNQRLRMRTMRKRYCAVQWAVYDSTTRVPRYANAGLPGPLHISPGDCRELRWGAALGPVRRRAL